MPGLSGVAKAAMGVDVGEACCSLVSSCEGLVSSCEGLVSSCEGLVSSCEGLVSSIEGFGESVPESSAKEYGDDEVACCKNNESVFAGV